MTNLKDIPNIPLWQTTRVTTDEMEHMIWAAAFIETLRYNGGDISWETADSAVMVYRKIKKVKDCLLSVKQRCQTQNYRQCNICDDWDCEHNTNTNKPTATDTRRTAP